MVTCDINVGKIALEVPLSTTKGDATYWENEGDVFDINRLTAKPCVEREVEWLANLRYYLLKIQAMVKEREPVMLFLV